MGDDTDAAALSRRLDAVERALTGRETPVAELGRAGEIETRLDDLEGSVTDLRERLDDLDARLQALRGYAGGVDAVNGDVERRADAALAKVESLERELLADPGLRVERPGGEDPSAATARSVDGRRGEPTPDEDTGADGRSLAARIRDAL